MTPTHVERGSATVLARPASTVAPQVSPAVFRSELARGMTPGEHADARSMLTLAQYRPGGGPGVQQVRPMPVPPSRGIGVGVGVGVGGVGVGVAPSYGYGYGTPSYGYGGGYGYATPGYGYATPGYGYGAGTGLSLGLTFGNGQTSLWAGTGSPMVGQQYYGQVAPYEMLVTDGSYSRWVRAGQQVPPGWVQTVPNWWNYIFTPYLY